MHVPSCAFFHSLSVSPSTCGPATDTRIVFFAARIAADMNSMNSTCGAHISSTNGLPVNRAAVNRAFWIGVRNVQGKKSANNGRPSSPM